MSNNSIQSGGNKSPRDVDRLASKTRSLWSRTYVFVKKSNVKTWKQVFILAFIAGAIAASVWMIALKYQTITKSAGENITVRAKGMVGGETIDLRVNNATLKTWTLTTNYQNYSFNAAVSDQDKLTVHFTNDNGGAKDVQIDYAIINGKTYQAESQTTNTGGWNSATGKCGGAQSEWLNCNGYIQFKISPTSTSTNAATTNNVPTGWFDSVDATAARGWVYDKDAGTTASDIQIVVDGAVKATIAANVARQDLVTKNIAPNAEHGFNYTFSGLSAGSHSVTIKVIDIPKGTTSTLGGSPRTIMIGGSSTTTTTTPTTTPGSGSLSGWTLNWSDEFNYTGAPNTTWWKYETGYVRNNEMQYYTSRPENVRVESGSLVLEARNDNYQGNAVTAGSIKTVGKKYVGPYGRLEVRAKLPKGKGTWPAIWQMGESYTQGSDGWPTAGEIDIMEYWPGLRPSIQQTLHFGPNAAGDIAPYKQINIGDPSTGYHIYAVEKYSDRIDFFIDSTKTYTYYKSSNPSQWPYDQRADIRLNYAFGGDFNPVDLGVLPQKFYVDYVRYYTKN